MYRQFLGYEIPKTAQKRTKEVLKSSNPAYTMLLVQGRISPKNMAFYDVPIGYVRFARYCGKMYSHRLFPCCGSLAGLLLWFDIVDDHGDV